MQYFTQIAYYIMFQSYENPEGSNPMPDSIEAVLQTFMMSLGSFGGHWWDLESTNHSFIGKVIVLQGDLNQNLKCLLAITLKLCISDPLLVKPKCV